MDKHLLLQLLLFSFCCYSTAQNVFVWAPNTFRLGSSETVGLAVYTGSQEVTLYLQDFPGRTHTFSEVTVTVTADNPKIVRMRVDPENVKDLELATLDAKHYVILVAKGKAFQKEVKVLVGLQAGYLFLQTDKPIYAPLQRVHTRIIPLNEDLLQNNQEFTFQIRNPQNIIVEVVQSADLKKLNLQHGIYSHVFQFPAGALPGDWSAVVLYGHKIPRNETVIFEMREYILPTFEVKLKVPEVILPKDEVIEVDVQAKYIYGQMVDGTATCKFGVKSETGSVVYFGRSSISVLQDGLVTCKVSRKDFERNKQVGWFPRIAGSRFVVEVIVLEKATGEEEIAIHSSSVFAKTKYLVEFNRSLKDFKPGLVATVLADIKEVSGRKAEGVVARIEVQNQRHVGIRVVNDHSEDISDFQGRVTFLVPTDEKITKLHITVTTQDTEILDELQGTSTFEMESYKDSNYVALERTSLTNSVKVGTGFASNVYSNPANLAISYAVTSSGRIVTLGSLTPGKVRQRPFRITITDEMVPSIRITLFAVYNGQALTDSIKLDVEDVCREKAKVSIESNFNNAEPGQKGKITVKGTVDTVVGILGLDKAVYLLRNQGLLTKEKMFSKMEEHDLGCGPGGGLDSQQTLANAGLVMITDTVVTGPERLSCSERRINKRSIQEKLVRRYDEQGRRCCLLGIYPDRQNRTCQERADIVRAFQQLNESDECANVFEECCLENEKQSDQQGYSDDADVPLEFVDEKDEQEYENSYQERKDFRELWLFQTGVIGSNNQYEVEANLPHSITTWTVQAVAINPLEGMCVADPAEVVSFKKIFMQLKLPYSVVRYEQIELRVTIFNYETEDVPVKVFMYGAEGLCSEAQPQEQSEKKKVWVPGNGGAATVGFPVVPMRTGYITIKVVAISPRGGDRMVKMLYVVPEGVPHEENIVFDIDPANLNKRNKRQIQSDKYETRIDHETRQQVSVVKLTPSQDFIPGTETCVVTAIGDKFGVTVDTLLNDPGKLIRLPTGCGEQNMAGFAPTLYAVHYLKVTGKLTPNQETQGYKFIREGYQRQLNYRKADGSYGAWLTIPSSTWLTAFVAKVFCQAKRYIFIDENSICSALDWLAKQQNQDGSFTEKHPIHHKEMTGGIIGAVPMTAFVLTSLYKCECKTLNLDGAKADAMAFLIENLPVIHDPYVLSIAAYALSLSDQSKFGAEANERLLGMSKFDEDLNQRYWGVAGTPISVETTSFALLTQLLYHNQDVANSIVNWLNTQRTTDGAFWSTQDTVIAIEALSEYAIETREPEMTLDCNITSSVDLNFKESLSFRPQNARVLRSYDVRKVSGRLLFEAAGNGVSTVGVKLSYNIPKMVGEICRFDIVVNVTEAQVMKPQHMPNAKKVNTVEAFPVELVDELAIDPQHFLQPEAEPDGAGPNLVVRDQDDRQADWAGPNPIVRNQDDPQGVLDLIDIPQDVAVLLRKQPGDLFKRQIDEADFVEEKRQYVANITICVKYLEHKDSNMAVVDVGIFTGFKPNRKDLDRLEKNPAVPISRFEEKGRSLVFYFDQISHVTPVCFWFRAAREFLVSHMESSLVKVYDYYEPAHTCSKFYSPTKHSAVVNTVCTGSVCRCAEGGCPVDNPFEKIVREGDLASKKKKLLDFACDSHDYVWKVEVEQVENMTSLQTVHVKVLNVLKAGRETADDIKTEPNRKFLGRRTCTASQLKIGKVYIIMGSDQEPVEQDDGTLKYTYLLNKQTSIYGWINLRSRHEIKNKTTAQKNLQKLFSRLESQFINEGCLD